MMISLSVLHAKIFSWDRHILWHSSKVYTNKVVEFQVDRDDSTLFHFLFKLNFNGDHAGIYFSIGLFGFVIMAEFYDKRHWDYKTNSWKVYN